MMKISGTNRVKFLAVISILAVTVLLYLRVSGFGFISVWDDNLNVTENKYIRDFTFEGIKTLFSTDTRIDEPRLTLFTYAIDYKLWGADPAMYHLGNLFLHLINIILVFFLAYRLMPKTIPCSMVALLFALHPFRVESVAWVSGRKDLLYSLFFLLALILYLRYLKKQKVLLFILVLILGYLSFLAKIQAVTLPLILLLLDFYSGKKITVYAWFEKVLAGGVLFFNYLEYSYLILLVLFYIFIKSYGHISGFVKNRLRFISVMDSRFTGFAIRTIFRTLFTFIPFWILTRITAVFYPAEEQYYLVLALLFLFSCWFTFEIEINRNRLQGKLSLFFSRHHSWMIPVTGVLLIFLVFFIFVKPGLYLWNNEFSGQFSFFDQLMMAGYAFFLYFSNAFFPVYFSSLRPYPDFTADFLPVSYYMLSVLSVLLIINLIIIIKRIKNLRKELIFAMFFFFINIFLVIHIIPIEGKVIIAERYTYLAYFGLFFMAGVVYQKLFESGKRRTILHITTILVLILFFMLSWFRLPVWKDELSLLNDQVAKTPDYPVVYLNRSAFFISRNNYRTAIDDLDEAIRLNPRYYQAYYNRALAYSYTGRFDKAEKDCSQALLIASDFANAYYLRGYSYNKLQKYYRAIADYNRAIELNPDMYLAYYNRGNSKKNISDYCGALHDYSRALELKPDFSQAYNARGGAEFLIKDFSSSIKDYSKALLWDPENSTIYFNRGLSYKSAGDMVHACEDWQKASGMGNKEAGELFYENCR